MKKMALVTGATSGIGREILVALIDRGYHVIAVGRNRDILYPMKKIYGSNVDIVGCDVRDLENLRQQLAQVLKGLPIDLVIHAAGILKFGGLSDKLAEYSKECMEVNYMGTVNVICAAAPSLKRGSHITVISSVGCLTAFPGDFTPYAASKAAVANFCENLRGEFRSRGISLTVAYPSIIDTPMVRLASNLPKVYRIFGWHDSTLAARGIIADSLKGRKTSFTTFSDCILAGLSRIAPRTFNKILAFLVKYWKT